MQLLRGSKIVQADDVVNGNREATLGLLWRVFLQFQVSNVSAVICTSASSYFHKHVASGLNQLAPTSSDLHLLIEL